jgi:hypothetical protein
VEAQPVFAFTASTLEGRPTIQMSARPTFMAILRRIAKQAGMASGAAFIRCGWSRKDIGGGRWLVSGVF